MNNKLIPLIYHAPHRRPMPGCLPLFLMLSLAAVIGGIFLVPVKMPERLKPWGEGHVFYRQDALLTAQVRQRSMLPFRLPPELEPVSAVPHLEEVPLSLPLQLLPAPPEELFASPPDSAVLQEADLLALPPDEEVRSEGEEGK